MFALGFGLGTKNKKGEWLETFFPVPILSPEREIVDIVQNNIKPLTDENEGLKVLKVLTSATLSQKDNKVNKI